MQIIDTTTITHDAKMRTILTAVERYTFDHLRDPQNEQEHTDKAVLNEFALQLTELVHGGGGGDTDDVMTADVDVQSDDVVEPVVVKHKRGSKKPV